MSATIDSRITDIARRQDRLEDRVDKLVGEISELCVAVSLLRQGVADVVGELRAEREERAAVRLATAEAARDAAAARLGLVQWLRESISARVIAAALVILAGALGLTGALPSIESIVAPSPDVPTEVP